MKDLVIWKANWILFDFVFWYNIDFVICGSLKSMCIVMGVFYFYFLKREKPYFEGWETLKKIVFVLLFILKFFRGRQSSIKIKHLFQGSCRPSKFLFQGSRTVHWGKAWSCCSGCCPPDEFFVLVQLMEGSEPRKGSQPSEQARRPSATMHEL